MTLWSILVVVLIMALLASVPIGLPYNAGWGYGPSVGIGGIVVALLIILALTHGV